MKKTLWAALLAAGTMGSAAGGRRREPLRIGVLPAADAIVIHAAADEKLFKARGLDVEVIPFKSALELGAAMRAGRLDGHFGDLMNVFTQNERGVPQAVILTTTHTSRAQRRPGHGVPSVSPSPLPPPRRSARSRISTALRRP